MCRNRLTPPLAFDSTTVDRSAPLTFRELAAATRVVERQIRYMIAEGFVPPRGGRARADYGDDHVAVIRRHTDLRAKGLPPSAIKVLLEEGTAVPFSLAPGLTLMVEPRVIGSGADVEPLVPRLAEVLRTVLEKDRGHGD
ncbi:helix-turn-helix domain-containing protein [Prosthecomicrobium sp. N25]|uniref:helix-turn-helix domain-containing protein n=1 Tax=Prosthecomicrobium sp. N25 TaxID=3129254 RepID=UPI0030782952